MLKESPEQTAEVEGRHHRYQGSHIPWYVHSLWITFWVIAIYYVLRFVFPAIQHEPEFRNVPSASQPKV